VLNVYGDANCVGEIGQETGITADATAAASTLAGFTALGRKIVISGSTWQLSFACSTSTTDCTAANDKDLTIVPDGGACTKATGTFTGYAYKLYSTTTALLGTKYFVTEFNAATAANANYVSEDQLKTDQSCTALTSTTTTAKGHGKLVYSVTPKTWALSFGCDANCANCDVTSLTLTLDSATPLVSSVTTRFFTLATATKGFPTSTAKTSAATLSFYAFALIALLLAALF